MRRAHPWGVQRARGSDACECARLFPAHASGTILPGITRKSIIELAKQQGYEVQERAVAVEEVLDADELFCTVRALLAVPSSRARRAWRALSLARARGGVAADASAPLPRRARRWWSFPSAASRTRGTRPFIRSAAEAHARARGAFHPG
jgi:hypothetical protein